MRAVLALLIAAACGNVKNEGTVDAPPASSDDAAPMCAEGTAPTCDGDNLVQCDGTMVACALGCSPSAARCNELAPSNGLAAMLDQAAHGPDLVFNGTATIDTDTGSITDGSGPLTPPTAAIDQQPIGIFVIEVKSLTAGRIDVIGSRALAIVSHGDISLKGVLALDARRDVSGPGAITNSAACAGGIGSTATSAISGGGGGGFGSVGGAGGKASLANGGTGGAVAGNIELVPLRGGCPGGHPGGAGPSTDPVASDPGGAGGAIQLVSRTAIDLADGAFVSANGAGGKGRDTTTLCIVDTPCGDGEGGGSGGAILLEAPRVTIASKAGLAANGGAGGCKLQGDAPSGNRGTRPASGVTCTGDTGSGGNGGAGATSATAGDNGLNDDPVGGGGGGGVGRIRINLPLGATFDTAGVVSPPPTVGVLETR